MRARGKYNTRRNPSRKTYLNRLRKKLRIHHAPLPLIDLADRYNIMIYCKLFDEGTRVYIVCSN